MTLDPSARIPVAGPSIVGREVSYVSDAAQFGWYEHANDYPRRFEAAIRSRIGVSHAIALPSCTSAIHLALLALGIGPGDEVIVPELTWIATAAPVVHVGATPVFADVDLRTWCISPDSAEQRITKRTRAIIPVDLYGGMPEFDRLRRLADAYGLALVEDAAEAIGSRVGDRMAGSFGDAGAFSFHGSKTVVTGEGGMLLTDRDDIANRALVLRDHGRAPGDVGFFNQEVGFKYRMSAVQAALGLGQIERLDELVAHKRALFRWYRERLADLPGLTLNAEPLGTFNSYWMVTVVLDPAFGIRKEALIASLADHRIDSRPMFYPLSTLPAFSDREESRVARARNVVAQAISPFGVNLPSAGCLDEGDVDRVCLVLRRLLRRDSTRVAA